MSSAKSLKLGIIGGPGVEGYSLSPVMHKAALRAVGLSGDYQAYPIDTGELDGWLWDKAAELDGFNITMPHKEAVHAWVAQYGQIPRRGIDDVIGALNTVKVEKGRLVGYNTDGRGFITPFLKRSYELQGKTVLLLGAGGAAQAIAVYLTEMGQIARLAIWNRGLTRARLLADKIKVLQAHCSQSVIATDNLDSVGIANWDIVVNATPLGMTGHGTIPNELLDGLTPKQIVYDIVYEPRETDLIRKARERNCIVISGEEMLIWQAAEAFQIWMEPNRIQDIEIFPVMKKALDEHFAGRG